MSRSWRLAAAALVLTVPVTATAQSDGAASGWFTLINTPGGAFAPMLEPYRAESGTRHTAVGGRFRVSHWQFASDDDNTTNYGGALVLRRGRAHVAFEVGLIRKQGCTDCGVTMGGVDLQLPLLTRAAGTGRFEVAVRPALGFARPDEDKGNALSLAVDVPLAWAIPVGQALRLTPFVAPGVGGGRVSGDGESRSGARAMLAGGLALQGARTPFSLTVGARRIFIDLEGGPSAPTIWGLGFTLTR